MRIGDFTDGHDEMPGWTCGMTGWNEVTEFSVFVFPVQRRVPQLVYTNKTDDCLFICLFIYLSVRLWTAKPQGLTG